MLGILFSVHTSLLFYEFLCLQECFEHIFLYLPENKLENVNRECFSHSRKKQANVKTVKNLWHYIGMCNLDSLKLVWINKYVITGLNLFRSIGYLLQLLRHLLTFPAKTATQVTNVPSLSLCSYKSRISVSVTSYLNSLS